MLKQTNVATAGGEDGWFSVPNAQLPTWLKTNTGTISFAFWFRKEANVTTFRHMIGVDQASANAPQWGLRYSDTTILLQLFDNAGTEVRRAQVSTGYPVNNEWCVIVGYVDRTGKNVGLGVVREGNPSGNFQSNTSGSGTGTIDTPNGSLVAGSRLSKTNYGSPVTTAGVMGGMVFVKDVQLALGVGLCWFNAWVPTIDGFVIGGAGWSGQGFTPQLDEGISEDLPARIAKACGATLVVLHMANQSTNPSDLLRMSTACRTGYSPGILWCGDQEHNPDEDATTGAWSNYVISASNPYCGVAIQEDPAIGDAESQFASGKKGNTYHPNAAGMAEAAQVALALFANAALAADAKRKLGVGVGIGIG